MAGAGGGWREIVRQAEEYAEARLTKKARQRFLSTTGPSLLVLTFIEDGARIFLRWDEQHRYSALPSLHAPRCHLCTRRAAHASMTLCVRTDAYKFPLACLTRPTP